MAMVHGESETSNVGWKFLGSLWSPSLTETDAGMLAQKRVGAVPEKLVFYLK